MWESFAGGCINQRIHGWRARIRLGRVSRLCSLGRVRVSSAQVGGTVARRWVAREEAGGEGKKRVESRIKRANHDIGYDEHNHVNVEYYGYGACARPQKDPSDSQSIPISPLPPKTNSRKKMSARRISKISSNRDARSALVALSIDAASYLACSDRLILSAARESLLHCDGSSISGDRTSNWKVSSKPAIFGKPAVRKGKNRLIRLRSRCLLLRYFIHSRET